jgi:hypothetical protein
MGGGTSFVSFLSEKILQNDLPRVGENSANSGTTVACTDCTQNRVLNGMVNRLFQRSVFYSFSLLALFFFNSASKRCTSVTGSIRLSL